MERIERDGYNDSVRIKGDEMYNLELTEDEAKLLKAILFKIQIDASLAKTLVNIQDKVSELALEPFKKGDVRKNGHR